MTDTLTHSQHLASIDLNDSVEVHNTAPKGHLFETLNLNFGPKTTYSIGPGERRNVPYQVVKMHFGDVRSSDEPQISDAHTDLGIQKSVIPPRQFEVHRLHVFYGLHLTQEDTFDDVQDRIPQVELIFDGFTIPTVFQDPLGKNVIAATHTISEAEALRSEVASLRAMIEDMQGNSKGNITRINKSTTRVVVPVTPEAPDTDITEHDFVGTLPTDDVDD
jgi:hypothetical protein